MMPTVKQITRLNTFLLDLHAMGIPPRTIVFSRRGQKPFIIIDIEPIHDIRKARWFSIDSEGELIENEKQV